MSEVAKEDKSYSAEDNLPGKDQNFGSSRVLFAHEASAGEKSIDLTALNTPSEMAANGFNQALSSEISAAHLSILRTNLTLISTRGMLIQFLDYVVTDAGMINFLPTSVLGVDGALEGELFTGTIDFKKAGSLVIGDVREYDVTIDDTNFTPGDTILNLGANFAVNSNPLNQSGEFRAYKNGKRIYRNVGNAAAAPGADGNFHEIDAGTGEGTTVELNVASQPGDIFGFDFGLKISSGDVAIFEELERLQGSFLKLATDSAPALGNPLSDYFTANPSEIERRAFGDLLLNLNSKYDSLLKLSEFTKTKHQTKILTANVTTNTTIADLTFNNLTPGKFYRAIYNYYYQVNPSSLFATTIFNGATSLGAATSLASDGGVSYRPQASLVTVPFIAGSDTVTFVTTGIAGTDLVFGDGSLLQTHAILEQLPNHAVTTDWT